MEKNKKLIIFLSVAAGVLALSLIVVTVFVVIHANKRKNGLDESSISETSSVSETEPEKDTTNAPVVSTGEDYEQEQMAENTTGPQVTGEAPEVNFQDVNEQVTAKKEVNLRSSMNQGTDDNIVYCLVNGDIAVRTGVGENGWSRVVYNGQTLYCVSSYLTADLSYVPPAEETDAFKTKFTSVSEKVTAKEVTNLRDRPSVLEPSQIVVQLNHGEIAVRTGIANEGWSRVEYNGQVLYCISSYLEIVEE